MYCIVRYVIGEKCQNGVEIGIVEWNFFCCIVDCRGGYGVGGRGIIVVNFRVIRFV